MKLEHQKTLSVAKLRVTPARITILNLFSGDCKPLNAEDIYSKTKDSGINLVTIYRTLNSLEKTGVLKRIDLHTESIHYELVSHHHHHIVCKDCGKLERFDACDFDVLSKKILKKSSRFNNITDHSFELFGMCKSCAKV